MRVTIKPTQILDPMFREEITVSNAFLPKDPVKAMVEVKEKLYARLKEVREGKWDQVDEETFIVDLLDEIERSL